MFLTFLSKIVELKICFLFFVLVKVYLDLERKVKINMAVNEYFKINFNIQTINPVSNQDEISAVPDENLVAQEVETRTRS